MRSRTRFFAATLMVSSLAMGAVACGSKSDDKASSGGTTTPVSTDGSKLAALKGKTIGVQSNTTGETYANEHKPEGATIKSFDDAPGLFSALNSNAIDAILQDYPINAYRTTQDSNVEVVETYKTNEQYGFMLKKGSPLKAELDKALKEVRDNGDYQKLYDKYFPADGKAGPGIAASDVKGSKTITVCSDIPYPPMEMEGDGPRGLPYTGFDIELFDDMAAHMDAKLDITAVVFDGIINDVNTGKCDVAASSVTITAEREKQVDFSDPYFDADQSLLVKKSN
jgi:polar amino acid transport system substrate-binding protein